jgi:anti-sigma B factor antagonist
MKPGILRLFARAKSPVFEQMQSQFTNAEEPTMKVETQGETLNVSGIKELGAANSQTFRDEVRGALGERQKNIEIDLSETMFVDSCGLGALISLHKTTCNRNGTVRLLNPTPPVQQILELTRMHRIFEIVNN